MPAWDATAVGLYSLQIAVLVAVAALAGRVARVSSAVVRLAYWRLVVAAALLLPLVPGTLGPESLPSFVTGTVAGVGTALAVTVQAPGGARIPVLWILAGGAILRAGWLALGLVRLRQLRRDSEPMPLDPELEALRMRLAPHAELRRHTGLDQPATFGREIVPAPPPPPAPTAGPLRPLRVGDSGVRPPQKLVNVPPVYPPEAREAKVQGVVILDVVIGADGAVARTSVVRSIPLLDQAAIDAVRQWRFEPTRLNGVPVEVEMVVTLNFTLAP